MRLRLVLPRRRRRGSQRRLGIACAAAVLAVAGCGGDDERPPAPPPLVLGITEGNPHLIRPGDAPEPFARWRDLLTELRPRYLRLLIVWSRLQPSPGVLPDFGQPADGCLRRVQPCAAFAGVRDELVAAREAGLEVVVTIFSTPGWAAGRPVGCERPGTPETARMPADLEAYRALVRALLTEAAAQRVDLRWWSPWNEPNHPAFLNPQRGRCSERAAAASPARYAELVRALKAELDAAPGEQELVLGETAGITPRPAATGAAEFARALPRDVVCGAPVWAQHAYLGVEDELAGDTASVRLLRAVEDALASHDCPGEPARVWITETGADPGDGRAGCRALGAALRRWSDDPRVDAAFQYTFREDTEFRVGLADAALTRLRPAYKAWRAATDGRPGPAAC